MLLAIGITWSSAETNDAFRVLKKYLPLLYIPMLMPIFNTEARKKIGVNIFLISITSILTIIYLMKFGIIPELNIPILGRHRPLNITIDGGFQTHIITNILMAFTAYIYLIRAKIRSGRKSLINTILFTSTAYYVIFISTGTTGQVLLIALITLFLFQVLNKKWIVIFMLLSSILVLSSVSNIDKVRKVHPNIEKTVIKLVDKYYQFNGESTTENVNYRPQRYINSIKMIASDPWFGTGTGSYYAAYKSKLPEIEKITTATKQNPHNEYLSIGVQVGLLGIALLIYLFYSQFKMTHEMRSAEFKYISQGFVTLMIIGSFVNSMIMDSGESHFFAYFSALLFSSFSLDNNQTKIDS
jgi:O-antigen ligase